VIGCRALQSFTPLFGSLIGVELTRIERGRGCGAWEWGDGPGDGAVDLATRLCGFCTEPPGAGLCAEGGMGPAGLSYGGVGRACAALPRRAF
jgi:hypothetical protein